MAHSPDQEPSRWGRCCGCVIAQFRACQRTRSAPHPHGDCNMRRRFEAAGRMRSLRSRPVWSEPFGYNLGDIAVSAQLELHYERTMAAPAWRLFQRQCCGGAWGRCCARCGPPLQAPPPPASPAGSPSCRRVRRHLPPRSQHIIHWRLLLVHDSCPFPLWHTSDDWDPSTVDAVARLWRGGSKP